MVASGQHLAIQIVALGLTNSRTTLHNVVLTRNSVARISKVARWFSPLYLCVVRPWECCKTRRIWSCNVVLSLHVTCPLVELFFAKLFSDQPWLSRENHRCCCTNTSSRDGAYAEYQTTTTTPKLTCEHTHDGSQFGVRPITLTHAPSSDHLTTRTMLSLHRTTLAFVAQRTHQDVRHIARSITYRCTTVAYWRFNTCVLSYEHFFHANIHKTACEFLHSHDILVASGRATIVTGPLAWLAILRATVLFSRAFFMYRYVCICTFYITPICWRAYEQINTVT